ncbi:MAG: N-acetylmuramoyl-L-alanine amidase family protein [Cellulosilyticum sp.]|nr:N-acetylmuramoyl-L-alanine amidase family protein [Cellulosilyticum sp.]
MKKRLTYMLLVGCLLSQSVSMLQAKTLIIDGQQIEYTSPPISLYVNKQFIQTTIMDPIQLDNRVLVPAREVFEAMGAKVDWNSTLKRVTVEYNQKKIVLIVNNNEAIINGETVLMDVPGKIINDKIMIPIRFVSEAIGMKVDWDSENRAVWIEGNTQSSTDNSGSVASPIYSKIQEVVTTETSTQFLTTILANSAMDEVKVMTLDDKVVIDILNSKSLLNQNISVEENTYIKGIRTSQFKEDTTRVVLDLKVPVEVVQTLSSDKTAFNMILTKKNVASNPLPDNGSTSENQTTGGNNTTGDNNVTNDEYDDSLTSQESLYVSGYRPKLNLSGVTSSKIRVTDDYRNKKLVFDLGADYSATLGDTEFQPGDGYVQSIKINTSGTTKITVTTNTVYTYQVAQDSNGAILELVRPREKYSQIVVLDIGHGGSDSGAVANGVKEKEVNFNQGMALYYLLEADPSIKVYMTRESDVYPTLQFRSQLANEIEADLFISIHNNSASANVTGAETLYYPNGSDTRGKQIAQMVQEAIVSCGLGNRGIKARSDLYVLRTTNMPAILLETGFLTNAAEAEYINSQSFINEWSQSVYNAIVRGFELLAR